MMEIIKPNKEYIRLSDSSSGYSCGTGWGGPKPGDPSNLAGLVATPIPGGVRLTWQYPTTNPGAVSHNIIYRNTTSDFSKASQLAIAQGNRYEDMDYANEQKIHYYWARSVSIYNSEGALIGPVSGKPLSLTASIIDDLSEQINAGHLSKSLQEDIEKIAQIPWLDSRIHQEIIDREFANLELIKYLDVVSDNVDDASAMITQEKSLRATADATLARLITEVSVELDGNLATATSLLEAGIKKNENGIVGVSNKIDEVKVNIEGDMAQGFSSMSSRIEKESTDRKTAVNAVSEKIDAVQVQLDGDIASAISTLTSKIDKETTDRKTAITSLSDATTTAQAALEDDLATSTSTLNSRITKEVTDLNTTIDAVSKKVDTVQTSLGEDISSVQTNMSTQIKKVDDKVVAIGALWTAKVAVNGLVGGFGVYNDGRTVEAGFDVDTFWVGKSSTKKKPFIVKDSNVYISNAFIENGTITTAKIGEVIQSSNYDWAERTGWRLQKSGRFDAMEGWFGGSLRAASGTFSGALTADAVNAVRTINIAGNSVTVTGIGNYPSGLTISQQSGAQTTASINMPAGGHVLIDIFIFDGTDVGDAYGAIYLNGKEIRRLPDRNYRVLNPEMQGPATTQFSFTHAVAVPPGTTTVTYDQRPFGTRGTAFAVTLSITGIMR